MQAFNDVLKKATKCKHETYDHQLMTHHCKTMELNGAKRKEVIEFSLELTEKIQNSLNVS